MSRIQRSEVTLTILLICVVGALAIDNSLRLTLGEMVSLTSSPSEYIVEGLPVGNEYYFIAAVGIVPVDLTNTSTEFTHFHIELTWHNRPWEVTGITPDPLGRTDPAGGRAVAHLPARRPGAVTLTAALPARRELRIRVCAVGGPKLKCVPFPGDDRSILRMGHYRFGVAQSVEFRAPAQGNAATGVWESSLVRLGEWQMVSYTTPAVWAGWSPGLYEFDALWSTGELLWQQSPLASSERLVGLYESAFRCVPQTEAMCQFKLQFYRSPFHSIATAHRKWVVLFSRGTSVGPIRISLSRPDPLDLHTAPARMSFTYPLAFVPLADHECNSYPFATSLFTQVDAIGKTPRPLRFVLWDGFDGVELQEFPAHTAAAAFRFRSSRKWVAIGFAQALDAPAHGEEHSYLIHTSNWIRPGLDLKTAEKFNPWSPSIPMKLRAQCITAHNFLEGATPRSDGRTVTCGKDLCNERNGACVLLDGHFECKCMDGWRGPSCDGGFDTESYNLDESKKLEVKDDYGWGHNTPVFVHDTPYGYHSHFDFLGMPSVRPHASVEGIPLSWHFNRRHGAAGQGTTRFFDGDGGTASRARGAWVCSGELGKRRRVFVSHTGPWFGLWDFEPLAVGQVSSHKLIWEVDDISSAEGLVTTLNHDTEGIVVLPVSFFSANNTTEASTRAATVALCANLEQDIRSQKGSGLWSRPLIRSLSLSLRAGARFANAVCIAEWGLLANDSSPKICGLPTNGDPLLYRLRGGHLRRKMSAGIVINVTLEGVTGSNYTGRCEEEVSLRVTPAVDIVGMRIRTKAPLLPDIRTGNSSTLYLAFNFVSLCEQFSPYLGDRRHILHCGLADAKSNKTSVITGAMAEFPASSISSIGYLNPCNTIMTIQLASVHNNLTTAKINTSSLFFLQCSHFIDFPNSNEPRVSLRAFQFCVTWANGDIATCTDPEELLDQSSIVNFSVAGCPTPLLPRTPSKLKVINVVRHEVENKGSVFFYVVFLIIATLVIFVLYYAARLTIIGPKRGTQASRPRPDLPSDDDHNL